MTAGEELSFSTIPDVFEPGALVTALLESRPVVLGHFRARADGSVAGTVTIPADTTTGWHVFRLTSKRPHQSVGVSIYVQGSMTPTPTPKPPHHPGKPGHPDKPEYGGHDRHGGHNDAHELPAAVEPSHSPDSDQNGKGLAATGSEQALVIGGTATALLMAGGGTILAVRRRRSS
ncbi:fibronectin type III domain-containing protein [Streptomyces azureus]|uniref:Fibronectin type III domain-containing protein n=1 Tax=Streptomyces azureus TaxID=146537 RepID=A0A0K8PMB0_STRAJ|nr:fibronectin type III domain-containing protein [Streptomyces azureus]